MSYIVYDVIIAAVLLFFVWLGYRKGLVLTLCSLLAVFVALIGASFLSDVLAEPVAKAIEPAIVRSIHNTVTSYYQRSPAETSSEDEEAWLAQLPLEEVLEPLRESRFFQGFADAFRQAVDERASELITHAARDLVARLPVLSTVNAWGGGAVGLVKGALIVFIAVWLLRDSYIPRPALEHTWLLKYFATVNPLAFFL